MRSILVMAMFAASLAGAAASDYEEERELSLGTSGIDALEIEAGAGDLKVTGVPGLQEIQVKATVQVPDRGAEKGREIVESDLVLTFERRGERAVLTSRFEGSSWSGGDSPRINLDVRMPEALDLRIDDGSGAIEILQVHGDIEVDDGSGSITMADVGGTIRVDDGSGSITATAVGGDLSIEDGSGGITVSGVAGSVTIDDGSGGIEVRDVDADLIIVDDGSGGLRYSDIRGKVENES